MFCEVLSSPQSEINFTLKCALYVIDTLSSVSLNWNTYFENTLLLDVTYLHFPARILITVPRSHDKLYRVLDCTHAYCTLNILFESPNGQICHSYITNLIKLFEFVHVFSLKIEIQFSWLIFYTVLNTQHFSHAQKVMY